MEITKMIRCVYNTIYLKDTCHLCKHVSFDGNYNPCFGVCISQFIERHVLLV